MSALDKLIAIEKRITDGPDTDEAWQERARLVHLLLPMAEALGKASSECELWINYLPDMVEPNRVQAETDGIRGRVADYRAVLAQLEEALTVVVD